MRACIAYGPANTKDSTNFGKFELKYPQKKMDPRSIYGPNGGFLLVGALPTFSSGVPSRET